jgi:hypothetical protein
MANPILLGKPIRPRLDRWIAPPERSASTSMDKGHHPKNQPLRRSPQGHGVFIIKRPMRERDLGS